MIHRAPFIIRGIEKRRIVDDDKDRESFVLRMNTIAEELQTTIYAWSLMTNHAHILLRSGPKGLSAYMRRLLTGYAGYYNRRHDRHGHLFENRYKSIVCDADVYLKELVRYIHLNPLRAGLIDAIHELDGYRWSGHSALIGKVKNPCFGRDFVLRYFGEKEGAARKAYREHLAEGAAQGRKPELVGGGLVRSLGGWSEVKSLRKRGKGLLSDERILGSGDFVERVINESDGVLRRQYCCRDRNKKIEEVVMAECRNGGVAVEELLSGGRRPVVSQVRRQIAFTLFESYGIPLAEIARKTGVSTSAISKTLGKTD